MPDHAEHNDPDATMSALCRHAMSEIKAGKVNPADAIDSLKRTGNHYLNSQAGGR